MNPTIYCLSQAYDLRLIVLAIFVCAAASFATFSLYPRAIAEAEGSSAPLWVALTSITAGSAIWATHFTAMLAFDPGQHIGFDIPTTIASFAVAMFMTGAAFLIAVHVMGRIGLSIAGLVLGAAISAMHYTGVSGMEVAGRITWNVPIIICSILFAATFSVAALIACGRGVTARQRLVGALLFGLSIVSLHFTGMAAVTIVPVATKMLPPNLLGGGLLATTVGIVTLLIVGSTGAAWLLDRRRRRENEIAVHFMARHDMLTGLPNRLSFEEFGRAELSDSTAMQRTAAILCLDLDGFKEVNDVFGHAAGDAVLIEVARRLQSLPGQRCVAARLGGDEFAVLAAGLGHLKTAGTAAQSVLDALGAPYQIEGRMLDIGCSIGVAMFPDDGATYQHLLSRADTALSRAKADGRGVFRYFEPAMDEAMRERRLLANDLRKALDTGQIRLAYQPQFDLATGQVLGFEALVRWDHPTRGAIPPATFIPVAEETGLILPLGEWVLREACREAGTWDRPLSIAVNMSVAQFRQTGLLETILSVLEETRLCADRLEIEVTESLFFEAVPRSLQVLERLRESGIRIAIDDFGTGFSSLSMLQSFAFDKIKIDRAFTSQIGRGAKGTAIVKAVIGLGNALGMAVVAEGVETEDQANYLRRQGCGQAQGYLYGAPRSIEHYAALAAGSLDMDDTKRVA